MEFLSHGTFHCRYIYHLLLIAIIVYDDISSHLTSSRNGAGVIHGTKRICIYMGCLKKTRNFWKNDCNRGVSRIFECVIIVLSIYV